VSHEEIARAFERWSDVEDVVATVNGHAFSKAVKSIPLSATASGTAASQQREQKLEKAA
jgi:hypothetical protein